MQYVDLGRTGVKASRFGMGCMRLPKIEDATNEAESIRMIRHAVDAGVNYFDTAIVYGDSEIVLGKALLDGYRERVNIATKLPPARYHEFDACLNEQLERLQVEQIDFYLLHFLCGPHWEKAKEHDLLSAMDKARDAGKIRFVGFSFHDSVEVFEEIVDAYSWDMCQIQLDYLDEDLQAGVQGLEYATARDIGVVIMEPLRGAVLVTDVPNDVIQVLNRAAPGRTPAEWAFRWLYNFSSVGVILSGVSTMEHLEEDLEIFDSAIAGSMTEAESDAVDQVRRLYAERIKVPCTGCGYCLPCPSNVDIPQIFQAYNGVFMTGSQGYFNTLYKNLMIPFKKDASQCVECGQCEEKCPQQIPIIASLKQVDTLYHTPA